MIRRFSVAAFAGAGAAAGEHVDDAVADLVPPAETISVPPRTAVDAPTEPSEDTINRPLLPTVTALAARTIDDRRVVSAIMHHREVRVGHLRARAWGHLRRRSQAHPSMPKWHCCQAHSMAVRNAAASMARILSHSPASAGS